MPIVLRKQHLRQRIYDLEIANGLTPSAPPPAPSRITQVFTRQRPVQLDRDVLVHKAIQVAMKPASLDELPPGERDQVGQVAKAIQVGSGWTKDRRPGNRRPMPKPQSAAVVAARAHQVLGPSSSVTPVAIAEAMQRQGLDFIEPFAPGQPLTPFYGYNRRPRTYDYEIGRNTTTETREGRLPYATLTRLWKSYDIAQMCTRYSIQDLRSMRIRFEAADGWEENPVKEIGQAKKFLRRPDGFYSFRLWLAMNQRNLWVFDSAPIYRQKDKAGRLKHLMNFTPTTLAPMLDYYGWFPEGTAPAYQQFIEGVPWNWLRREDVIYWPFWPESGSPYGTPPLETVLINANTDVRLQLFFLQFFTEGTVPEAFAIAPEDMTSQDDLATLQEWYNDEQNGDQAQRYGLKWLPHGTEINVYKPQTFDPTLAEYVERRTIAAHGLTPQNLGILATTNRATATTQVDQEFRISTLPIVGYYEDLVDSVLQDDLTLPVQVRFDTGREKEDRLMEAEAHQIYVSIGAESADEVREKVLGYPVNPEERVPRFWDSQRLGPVPLEWLMSVAGDVDPLTGAPRPGTVERREFVMVGQQQPDPPVTPPSTQYGNAAERDAARGRVVRPKDPGMPVTASREKVYPRVGRPSAAKTGQQSDEPIGPEGWGEDQPSASADDEPGYGVYAVAPTASTYGSTGQGLGMRTEGDTQPPHLLQAENQDMTRWQRQSRDRVAKGKAPRLFADSAISPRRSEAIWARLEVARSRAEVDEAFAKAKGPIAAGLVVQAQDTGRVLMVQRQPDTHDPGEAYARWEFPGGHLDGDDPWTAGVREWQEETGATLPPNAEHLGNWTSPDGVYVGYVLSVPQETDVALRPQRDEVSNARWWAKDDLDDPEVRDKVTETLTRVTPLLKGWADTPRDRQGRWTRRESPGVDGMGVVTPMARAPRWADFHHNTDQIVAYYTPLIEQAMASRITREAVHKVIADAYRNVAKATPTTTATRPKPPLVTPAALPMLAQAGVTAAAGAGFAAAGVGVSGSVANLAGTVIVSGTTAGIVAVISNLYADAYLQGAHEAAEASGGTMPPWTVALDLPPSYWAGWKPGMSRAAQLVAGTGLAQLLADAGVVIKGVDDTQLQRIGDAIARGIEHGFPVKQVEAEVAAIIDTAARANMIAETEYARAMARAQMDTYVRNGVPELQWLHEPNACARCMENVAASPQPAVNPQWPQGPIPVHPRTRCAISPWFGSLTGGRP